MEICFSPCWFLGTDKEVFVVHTDLSGWLIDSGTLTSKKLESFIRLAGQRKEPLWAILLEAGKITEAWLADTFAQHLKIPLISLALHSISTEAVHHIPERIARRYACIPFARDNRVLQVAMVDPTNLAAIQDIEFFTGLKVQLFVSPRSEILEAIEEHFAHSEAVDFIAEAELPAGLKVLPLDDEIELDEVHSRRASEIPPIIKLVNLVLAEALQAQASDIHIEPTEHDVRVRLRVDGVLRDYLQAPTWLHAGLTTRLKVMAKLDIAERRRPQDGRFKVHLQNRVVDVRVSTLPTQFGEKAVMRLLEGSGGSYDLKVLGLPEQALQTLVDASDQPQGMIIVTGPTGSGKSTTLYSLLSRKLSSKLNVVTVEDPIEYQLAGANQVQVNVKAGLTFASCLRSILRQDPDVILVGEIRDRETAEIAFHAAMTGHLVLTTLHTNSSVATVLRLFELGVDPFVITSSISTVVAQRLARRTCIRCRKSYAPSDDVLERLKWGDRDFAFQKGGGCKDCHQTEFKGRVGIYEILKMTAPVCAAINRKASEAEIAEAAAMSGFTSLLEDARSKIRAGITTPEEVLRVIQLRDTDKNYCPRCSHPMTGVAGPCPSCNEPNDFVCAVCGAEVSPNWQFCPRCGKPPQWGLPESDLARHPDQRANWGRYPRRRIQ
jgi:type II secretory ATPase GspE/PulE/Tfp pilus assembly ATPase PilB-like protein